MFLDPYPERTHIFKVKAHFACHEDINSTLAIYPYIHIHVKKMPHQHNLKQPKPVVSYAHMYAHYCHMDITTTYPVYPYLRMKNPPQIK